MKIGEVIRKFRKSKGITQEEMAKRLGVSTPAVNKWENGNSFPDIELLAPIARLLNISVDTLVSFQEELTPEEISGIIYELDSKLKEGDYETTFQWAKVKLEQYPNCEQLMWQTALLLDVNRLTGDITDKEIYEGYINQWYIRALESPQEDIRNAAADSLFGFYVRKDQYEKAEEYLSYFSKQNPERKRKQALIYSKTGRKKEAYKLYEELLLSAYQMTSMIFHGLYLLAMQDEDREKSNNLVEKQSQLAAIFEMGEYYEASWKLDLAVAEKDIDSAIGIMQQMLSNFEKIDVWTSSSLYEHLSFKKVEEKSKIQMRDNLLKSFRNAKECEFLKDDKRWQALVK